MDYDSDLTDLSDEYAAGPSTKESSAEKAGYKPGYVLRPPKTSTYSTWALYEWIQSGEIELEPEYQRDVVWPDSKQSKLIDSILRNFYIPPVIFSVIEEDDGHSTRRVCIDGKQRLTSIQRFMDGLIPHIDTDDRKKHWFKPVKGKGTVLPDWLISGFKKKQIVCVEYYDLPSMWEREIFQRVQLGMPLQPAERMAAHVGPWALFATTIKQEYLSEGSQLLEYWGVETSRARDFQYAAQIIMGIYTLPARCSFTTPVLDKWLQRQDPPTEKFKRQIRELFDRYMAVGPFNVQKVISPVEFVMITILIKLHPNANEAKLGELISEFRTKLKRNHVDLRTNNKVLKTAYDIIEGQLGMNIGKATENKRGKRKATRDDDDDDDDDYRGPPVMKKPAGSRPTVTRSTLPAKPTGSTQVVPKPPPSGTPLKTSTSKALSNPGTPSSAGPSRPPLPPPHANNPPPSQKDPSHNVNIRIAKLKQLAAQSAGRSRSNSAGQSAGDSMVWTPTTNSPASGPTGPTTPIGPASTASLSVPPAPVVAPNNFVPVNLYRNGNNVAAPSKVEPEVAENLNDWFGEPGASMEGLQQQSAFPQPYGAGNAYQTGQ